MTTKQSTPSPEIPLHDWAPESGTPSSSRYPDDQHPLGPLRPIARRWPLVLIVTVLAAAGGAAIGLKRAPTWSASSEINVGRVDVRVQALPGYVAGAQSLASAYSRIAESETILRPVGRQLDLSPLQVAGRVEASPVPGSPIFRITGHGGDQQSAIQLTNAMTDEVKRYVTASDTGQKAVGDLLERYRDQVSSADKLRRKLQRLQRRRDDAESSPTTVEAPSATQIRNVRVDFETAQLRSQALASQYQNRADELASTAGVQVISTPLAAASDRNSTLQRLVTVGLVGGLIAGSLLALLVDALARRRRLG